MDYPFTTDGCSGGHSARWRFFFGVAPPWEGCCIEHDKLYWQGGTREERRAADRAVLACVRKIGHPVWGLLIWAAVRVGGHPLLPLPWRWGYGWKYPRPYSSSSAPKY
jgi:hypothetical protein